MTRFAIVAALGALSLMGCQSTENKADHPCATCKDIMVQERHGKHDINRSKHDCKCPGCSECKGDKSCKSTECHSE